MNLTNFLKQTDALAGRYSTGQLAAFIHEIGRVCPEHCREYFLETLKSVGDQAGDPNQAGDPANQKGKKDMDLDAWHHQVLENLKRIDSREIAITGIWNEEYDDWRDDEKDEFYYQDDSGISDMIQEACDFVYACMDRERYQVGFEVGNQLLAMEVRCENDYGDEEFSLEDMAYHEVLDRDLRQVFLDTAYCAYRAVTPEKRPEALYGVLANARRTGITLEAVMQHGDEELSSLEDFMPHWIEYLGDKTGREADRLILEAVGLLNDRSLEVQYAEKYAALHPRLYVDILERGSDAAAKDMASIGLKAVRAIPKNFIMRSRAALKTAEYVNAAGGEPAVLGKCYVAAYESDTSALNYLRALLNSGENDEAGGELLKIRAEVSANKTADSFGMYDSSSRSERAENKPDRNTVLLLRFLEGEFADVLDRGLNVSKEPGWTGRLMEQGVALYLLYLHEGPWKGRGIAAMAEMAKRAMRFSAQEYRKGLWGLEEIAENDLFYQVFSKWKSMAQMQPDVRNDAIKRITALIEKRTAETMEANRRSDYGDCAAYIAALGEVLESMGEKGAKQRLMDAYKEQYSRRSAFRGEMKKYGWTDTKKK